MLFLMQASLCGLLRVISPIWNQWNTFSAERLRNGFRPPAVCTNRQQIIATLIAADQSATCTGQTAPIKRRNRSRKQQKMVVRSFMSVRKRKFLEIWFASTLLCLLVHHSSLTATC